MQLDKIDRKILQELIENARIPIITLAQKVGLTKSPCQRRIKILEENGLIERFTIELNAKKAGIAVSIFATVEFNNLSVNGLEEFEEFVRQSDEISECYVITGTNDYLIKIIAPSFEEYEAFIKKNLLPLPSIRRINTMVAYREVKNQVTLPRSLLAKTPSRRTVTEQPMPTKSRTVLPD